MNFYQQSFHMSPLVEDSNFSYHQTDFNMEPSSLLQCRKADQDWMCEDPHVGSLQWDMAIGNYTFPQDFSNIDSRTYGDARNSSEQLHGLDTSTQEDDVLSYSLSPSVSFPITVFLLVNLLTCLLSRMVRAMCGRHRPRQPIAYHLDRQVPCSLAIST